MSEEIKEVKPNVPDAIRETLKNVNFGISTLSSKTNFTYFISRIVKVANATEDQIKSALDKYTSNLMVALESVNVSKFNLLDSKYSSENGTVTLTARVRAVTLAKAVRPKKVRLVVVIPEYDLEGNMTNADAYDEYQNQLALKKANPVNRVSGKEITPKAKKPSKVINIPAVNQLEVPELAGLPSF